MLGLPWKRTVRFRVSLPFQAFLQATGVVVYLLLLSWLFFGGLSHLSASISEFFWPIIMLMAFIISAVVTSTLVLGRVAMLFWERQYRPALALLLMTIGWCTLYLAGTLAFLIYR